jgi:hypothetical protein
MKLLISLLMIISLNVHADIIRITFQEGGHSYAEHIKETLGATYNIPVEFIQLVQVDESCRAWRRPASWHLCINKNGDLQEVSVDSAFVKETLKVFL